MISQVSLDVVGIVSVWFETLLYGIYVSLFFEAVFIMLKKGKVKTTPSKIFFWTSVTIFILSTIHISLNLFRVLKAYVWLRGVMAPTEYLLDLSRWDIIMKNTVNAVTTWLADFLVIYRCFIIWNNNYYIIIFPTLLVLMSIASNTIALYQFTQVPFGTFFGPSLVHWINIIYALAFVQNSITTGLIAWKIWHQERHFVALGMRSLNPRASLFPILRIIVESASIYLLELLVLIILYALKHNGQFVLEEAVVPTVGIVFTIMTVRLAMRNSKRLMTTTNSRNIAPIEWNINDDSLTTTSGLGTQISGLVPQDIDINPKGPKGLDVEGSLR
ncbi:hypothetical protein BD779DRAFT_1438076 [Infundibulicybe gibba]|nr:hypothetical protein BD779DRAFT_1438076 [Infundibulicybe gibba]